LRRAPSTATIHVVVPWARRVVGPPGVVVRRSRQLPDLDVVKREDGIAVTSPPRTVFDAAALLSHHDLQSMIEDALYRGLFMPVTLRRVAERLGHPCREGSRLIAQVLAARDFHATPVASEYELRLERAMIERGFPALTRQYPIEIAPGKWIHPDLGLPEQRFFVEVDHRRWHDSSEDRSYDAWRDRRLRLLGCWVERVSDLAIDHQLADTVEDLWAAWHRVSSRHAASA
jgi:very-short-patch-repair endonuclease